ncbi:serine hydrolase [Gelidibacter sp.]|uniref:serine hydrolase n=1 Tax=Gelidibacter sp. TaxID=2018083 RepID=UPI002BC0DE7B|nr:serine hydrolase [Gelidibacter sp.]HUH27081.1 serine hydrolase [Gelidibacter sp.]
MTTHYFKRFSITLLVFVSLFINSLVAQESLPENLDAWIESGRKDWKIPGMAVGIVKDGEVVYAKGFGEKRLGSGEKVDANTIFSIASVSKNMTAAALAILVDEGKINWDDKIVQHIPWFQLKDPWVTQEITIRDVLTHRVGLGRILGNRLQFMTKSSRDSVLYQMRYMNLEKPFRSSFVYNNVMYSIAGQIIEYADGRTWDAFLNERLFAPLDMNASSTSITQINANANQAYPHQEIEGKVVPISRRNWDNAGPAGGVNASINDLNKWMLMQLGVSGEYNGKTIISEKQMNEIHKQQMVVPQANAMAAQGSYGFGWNITDYKGKRVLTHGGATDGFNTAMYLMPELDLGIIVVGNNFNSLGNAVAYQVMDAYLGHSDIDWNERYLQGYKRSYARALEAREKIHQAQVLKTKPSLALDAYMGVYKSAGYGKVEVKKQDKDLVLHFWDTDGLEAKLEHWHYDTFRAVWKNPAQREEFMQFHLGKDGMIEALDFEFSLRPLSLQVGAYPSNYTHTERFIKLK